jgi:ribulose bisphosphate carboxylase small subunit
LIGEIENPQLTTSTDQDGNSVTVNKGKLGGADVVETIVERPDGQTSHSLSYSGSVSGAFPSRSSTKTRQEATTTPW